MRFANGTITTFDVPGAGTDQFQGTLANAANVEGVITGEFFRCELREPRLRAHSRRKKFRI